MEGESKETVRKAVGLRLLDQHVRVEAKDCGFLRGLEKCFEAHPPGPHGDKLSDIELRVLLEDEGNASGKKRRRWRLTTDPREALRLASVSVSHGVMQLVSELNRWAVATTVQHYVFHAGAVARQERAILLPGGPFSGKTTVTAGLVQRGFELLSDEVGAIAVGSGHLVGYPRALSIRHDVLPLLGLQGSGGWSPPDSDSRMFGVGELAGTRAPSGALPALIVVPQFLKGEPTRLEELRPGPAVLALMEASCSQARFKVRGLDLVVDLARRLPCHRLVYSDLSAALDRIEEAFARASRGVS